jgi:hypothetical protein
MRFLRSFGPSWLRKAGLWGESLSHSQGHRSWSRGNPGDRLSKEFKEEADEKAQILRAKLTQPPKHSRAVGATASGNVAKAEPNPHPPSCSNTPQDPGTSVLNSGLECPALLVSPAFCHHFCLSCFHFLKYSEVHRSWLYRLYTCMDVFSMALSMCDISVTMEGFSCSARRQSLS